MTLRTKIIVIICVTCALSIVTLFSIQQTILATRFSRLEEQNTSQNVDRALSAVSQDVSSVATAAADWGVWDDTYAYVQDGNEDYVIANFQDSSFTSLKMNLIAVINTSGVMVHGEAFDMVNEEEVPIPTDLGGYLAGESLLTQHPDEQSSIAGILLLSEGPMLIASQSILTSEGSGPVQGSLIMGRYLDLAEVQRLAELTHLSLTLRQLDDDNMPADFQLAQSSLSEKEPTFVHPLNNDLVAGYGLLTDIYGKPALVLRVDLTRDIYAQGQQTIAYVILAILVLGALAALTFIFLLDKLLLSRLARLRVDVDKVGAKRDLAGRVPATGKDELAEVGQAINRTLASLDQSQQELVASEARNRILIDAIPDSIFRVSRNGTLLDRGPAKADEVAVAIRQSAKEGQEETADERRVLSTEIVQRAMPYLDQTLETGQAQIFEFKIPLNSHISHYEARVVANGRDEVLVIVRDITQKKHEEEARRRGLLLKEIHHRVKNNLQVISSLLYLQSKRMNDNKVIEMFNESSNRIQSISLIHQKLYQSKDAATIDFGGYANDLASALFRSYGVNQNVVRLRLDIHNTGLSMDSAIPCGLIINELVSNSLKYAFPGGREGEIQIAMSRDRDDRITLVVADNGIGLPKGLDFLNGESLGLQLVATLVDQLRGTMALNRKSGAEFTITFTDRRGVGAVELNQERYGHAETSLAKGGHDSGKSAGTGS